MVAAYQNKFPEVLKKEVWRSFPPEERTEEPVILYSRNIAPELWGARPLRISEINSFTTTLLEEYYAGR